MVESCYANPDRKKFPDFHKNRGTRDEYQLDSEFDDPKLLFEKIDLELVESFDKQAIKLHDTSCLWTHVGNNPTKASVDN